MKPIISSFDEFIADKRPVILLGAKDCVNAFIYEQKSGKQPFPDSFYKRVKFALDDELFGNALTLGSANIPIYKPAESKNLINNPKDYALLICSEPYTAETLIKKYGSLTGLAGIDTYIYYTFEYIFAPISQIPQNVLATRHPLCQIPKVFHYIWLKGRPMPDQNKAWIDTWLKYNPDYSIKCHNEDNYDFLKQHYMKQAYESRKLGFVPDYARLDIIYNEGGIYLDTDVEACRSFDGLLNHSAFFNLEHMNLVNPGSGFGAIKGYPLLKELMDVYDSLDFIKPDGTLNMTISPIYATMVFKRRSEFNFNQNVFSVINSDCVVYPREFFSPKSHMGLMRKTQNTYSIHHYDASWKDKKEQEELEQSRNVLARIFK